MIVLKHITVNSTLGHTPNLPTPPLPLPPLPHTYPPPHSPAIPHQSFPTPTSPTLFLPTSSPLFLHPYLTPTHTSLTPTHPSCMPIHSYPPLPTTFRAYLRQSFSLHFLLVFSLISTVAGPAHTHKLTATQNSCVWLS